MRSDFKDEVKARTNILDVIGAYTVIDIESNLKWKEGKCPFCETGKILVEPDEQAFKCPCCDLKGDVFAFLQEIKNESFAEVLVTQAKKVGVQIPKKLQRKVTNGHSEMGTNEKQRRKIFGFFKRSIPYFKELRKLTGSVTASILMSQLEYWFEDNADGFYKFLEPPSGGHPLYKFGDSWCEELAFSKEEFRTAFDRIGIRYASKTQFFATDPADIYMSNSGDEMFYCSYFDKVRGTTHYFRNPKTDHLIDELLKNYGDSKSQSPEIKHKKKQKV